MSKVKQSLGEHIAGLLAWCGGAKVELVREYPEERTRLATIGATVLFTSLFAGASSSYAIYTVFGRGWWVPVLAMLWGAAIFNIDRLIVMTMCGDFARKLVAAIPRLVLATVIAIVITRPLELWIFAPEIDRQIAVTEGEIHDGNINAWNAEVVAAQQRYEDAVAKAGAVAGVETSKAALDDALAKVSECNKDLERALAEHLAELNGTGGTKRVGNGPIAKELLKRVEATERRCEGVAAQAATARRALDATLLRQAEAAKDHIVTRDQAIAEATKRRDKKSEGLNATRIDSLLGRNQQLAKLVASDPSVSRMNLFLILLFWLIEALPVLSKLMVNDSIYDAAVDERRETFRAMRRGVAKATEAHEGVWQREAEAAAKARKEVIELHYEGFAKVIEAARAAWKPPQALVTDFLEAMERVARQNLAAAQPQQVGLGSVPWSLRLERSRWQPLIETVGHLFIASIIVVVVYYAFKLISPFERAILNYVMTAIGAAGTLLAFRPLKRIFASVSGGLMREEK